MPDLDREIEDLARADQDIAEGERRIAEQQVRIREMVRRGENIGLAEQTLRHFVDSLAQWREHRRLIVDAIGRARQAR
jgi:hypothetical protein